MLSSVLFGLFKDLEFDSPEGSSVSHPLMFNSSTLISCKKCCTKGPPHTSEQLSHSQLNGKDWRIVYVWIAVVELT